MPRNLARQEPTTMPSVYQPTHEAERIRDLAYIGRLFSTLRFHWKLFAAVFLGFVTLAMVATLVVPKQYTATVKMIVGGAENQADAEQKYTSLPVLNAFNLESADVSSDTVAELVQETPVVSKVIEALQLPIDPQQLLGHVSVKPVLNTPVLALSATWHNSDEAVAIANTFSTVFVARQRELIGSQAVAAENYLKTAISESQGKLTTADAALSAYQAHVHIADVNVQTQALLGRLEAAESKIDQLQDDEKQAQAQLTSATQQIASMSPMISGQQATDVNPAATQLQAELTDVQVKLASALARYTPKFPAVIALEQQRDDLKHQIAALPQTVSGQQIAVPNPVYEQLDQQASTLRGQIQGDAAQIVELQKQRKDLAPSIAALPAQTAKLGFLEERAKLASDVYNALEQKYDEAVVAANSAISDVTVVQAANPNDVTVSPNVLFNAIISIAIGLILGLLAVAIVDALQRRIREDRDVERSIGLPVIAHIPMMTSKDQRALPWLQTVTLEAFLHLCASLRMVGQKHSARVICITSPQKGDGKSTIAYNLATAMSRIKSPVLLIDCDMRCPAANVQAHIENGKGLADVLSAASTFDESVVRYSPTLDILTAGTIPANPVGLIESTAFDELLELARDRYEFIVVDTPALAPVVDSVLIAGRADATAIVISANTSGEGAAAQAATRLRALGIDNVLGVIMNRTKTKFADYSDYFAAPPSLPTSGNGGTGAGVALGGASANVREPVASLSVIVPAHNEGAALRGHLLELLDGLAAVREFHPIQYIVVDDGSTDETYKVAESVCRGRSDMLLLRHEKNLGLGGALKTALAHATGTFVLAVDSDMSYSSDCLLQLLRTACDEDADVVMASAYMRGGKVRGVPWMRAILSREANRFLSLATGGRYHTLTCMVRVYRRDVLEGLSFKADGMDVNAEIAFAAIRSHANIVEIPATLQWPEERKRNAGRASIGSICTLTWRTFRCGLRHRPALAIGIPGLIPGLLPAVIAVMLLLHCSPRTIALGSVITMVIQYGSLAVLGGQALSFLTKLHVRPAQPLPKATLHSTSH